MVAVVAAGPARTQTWLTTFEARLTGWFTPFLFSASVGNRLRSWNAAPERALAVLTEGEDEVGHVAVARHPNGPAGRVPDAVTIHDLWIDPAHRGRGYGRAALDYAQRWARGTGAPVLSVTLWQPDPVLAALFAGCPLRHQRMAKRLDAPVDLAGAGWTFRPLQPGPEYDAWRQREVIGYAADLADSGSLPADQARIDSEREYDETLALGPATPDHSFWVVEAGGEPVADIWLHHALAPGLGFVYSVAVRPEFRGRGYGRAVMLVGEDRARAAGNEVLGLNVFGHNNVAIGLYDSLGYTTVEATRSVDL